ncbi:MAG TPA: aspartate carbamoyltransferase [Candidatus Poseidoniales archaeon]|nr:aspartate carbamoyltransferase [Candidatus Poseidoniales archaeon]HIL43708.1 aspartate carbamoyltransferase [Candidatus Poseidoniales archaeon]
MDDLTNKEITSLLDNAERLLPAAKGEIYLPLLEGKVLANMFFENSTRTRMSFESAMKRLGGSVLNFSSAGSSVAKGETLYDTMQMIDGYADVVAIRHPQQGAAQYSADAIEIPVLNAGDGAGNHPTQTLLDLFTIREAHGTLEGLNVILVGDLRYGRTVHSLSHALVRFGATLTLVSPKSLQMPSEIVSDLNAGGAEVTETADLAGTIAEADVIYMTRIQKERFPDEDEYTKVAGIYMLTASDLSGAKESMVIMHPLPRVNEIHPSVDSTPHARYFQQAFNGVVARMALLCDCLNVKVPKKVK